MSHWIDRRIQEPPTDKRIFVWAENDWAGDVYIAYRDYDTWLANDGRDVDFLYWQPIQIKSPYES